MLCNVSVFDFQTLNFNLRAHYNGQYISSAVNFTDLLRTKLTQKSPKDNYTFVSIQTVHI